MREMHTRSGLLSADRRRRRSPWRRPAPPRSRSSRSTCPSPDRAAVRQLDRHRPPFPRRLPARDRGVPALPVGRRVDDEGAGQAVVPRHPGRAAPQGTAHRALDDIRESIEELRFYRERLFVPASSSSAEPPAPPDGGLSRHPRPPSLHPATFPWDRPTQRGEHERPREDGEEDQQRHREQRRGHPPEGSDPPQHPPQLHRRDQRTARPRRPAQPCSLHPRSRATHHVACTCKREPRHRRAGRRLGGPHLRRRRCSSSTPARAGASRADTCGTWRRCAPRTSGPTVLSPANGRRERGHRARRRPRLGGRRSRRSQRGERAARARTQLAARAARPWELPVLLP